MCQALERGTVRVSRYQRTVRWSPSSNDVFARKPKRSSALRVSRRRHGWPLGLEESHTIRPANPTWVSVRPARSAMETSWPDPRFTGSLLGLIEQVDHVALEHQDVHFCPHETAVGIVWGACDWLAADAKRLHRKGPAPAHGSFLAFRVAASRPSRSLSTRS